ncbi:MFS transporter [Achaetomium macrosporum]|uniref:Efflux pump dotC n=1 Tax=Achaetomium macrosporum TaxID=79813 RepID=A0AAN7C5I3_9PEZI|nr:MFS transporter [Achaetomium macrosporum]
MTEAATERAGEQEKNPVQTVQNDSYTAQNATGGSASQSRREDDSDKTAVDSEEERPAGRSPLKIALIMLALCFAVFLPALDITIITTALPTIIEDFDSGAAYTWVGSAYLLGVAASSIVWAKLSDIFGRKPAILSANVTFFVGSLIAALSVNAGMLITARAIQGIGGAGLNVLANICVGDLFSPRRRGVYYGIIGGVWAVAMSVGPLIGGAFTQNVSWHWCFYVNLPFNGLAFVIIFFFLDLKTPKTPLFDGIRAIDWTGVILSIGSTLMFLLGLSFGGETYSWRSATVICLIVFGFVGWVLCFVWEARMATYPLMPTRIFKRIPNLAILGVCFIQSYAYIASAYYLPLYFQAVLSADPILSGVYLLPTALSLSAASIATGVYMGRTGQYLAPMYLGFLLQTLGYGLFIDLGPTADWAKIILFQIVTGLGVGPNFQAPMVALQSFISPRELAAATSAFAFTRNVAGSVSVVIGQVVLQNEMNRRRGLLAAALGPQLAAELGGSAAIANTQLVRSLPPDQRDVAHRVFADSMRYIWIMYTAFSAPSLVLCLFVGRKKLSREHRETVTGLEAEREAREERLREEREKGRR